MNLISFEYYLKDNNFAATTTSEMLKSINLFAKWAEQEQLQDIIHITHNEILNYVQYLKQKGLSVKTVNNRINIIRKYFEHLKEESIIENNPVKRLHIKGAIKKVIINPLTYNELESLYNQYLQLKSTSNEIYKQAHKRNIIILGLMVWQGLHSGELSKLETGHINLNEGTIYIPSIRRSNSRELKLNPKQMITLYEYIETTTTPTNPNNHEQQTTNHKLFSISMKDTVSTIISELKGINPVIQNAAHIRASVILNWLKLYDKRKVQYLTGHKWISSTEQYAVQEMETLTDQLTRHHPFS